MSDFYPLFGTPPPPSASTIYCNPLYCNNPSPARSLSPAKFDEMLGEYFRALRPSNLLTAWFSSQFGWESLETFARKARSAADVLVVSTRPPSPLLEKFKEDFRIEIETRTQLIKNQPAIYNRYLMQIALTITSCGNCPCSIAASPLFPQAHHAAIHAKPRRLPFLFVATYVQNRIESMGTDSVFNKSRDLGTLCRILGDEMLKIFEQNMKPTDNMPVFIEFIENIMTPTKIAHNAILAHDLFTQASDELDPFPTLSFDSLAWLINEGAEKVSLKENKRMADEHAKNKQYDSALFTYTSFNHLSLDSTITLQSLTNTAAIRLRLAKETPLQLPAAILDCTFALQIDSNCVKALFRRGLALALLKRWKQAISDFERALELDPYSPAKAELVECRKHV